MATILMLDRSLVFGPDTVDREPLGGSESAFTWLARALARRGHRVHVRTLCSQAHDDGHLEWAPFETPPPARSDMVIANRRWYLFPRSATAGRRVLWLHNPADGLRRLGRRAALAWLRPTIVTLSRYHRSTIPAHLWGTTSAVIPLAPAALFAGGAERPTAPPPRALFTSNPIRGLDRLLHLWQTGIQPAVPTAELRLFGGLQTYQAGAGKRAGDVMERVLEQARGLSSAGVALRDPVARTTLLEELGGARALLYLGSDDETYCFAAAEAQAMGVPAVLGDVGSLSERVVDGETGFLVRDETRFVERAIQVLSDDALWLTFHRNSLARQRQRTWDDVAADFERLM